MPNPMLRRRSGVNPYPMLAAHFASASSQFGSIANNASLQIGTGNDMTLAFWVWIDAGATSMNMVSKYQTAGQLDYLLWWRGTGNPLRFQVTSNGASAFTVDATNFGAPGLGAWIFVVGQYDGSHLSVGVNNGTMNQTAYSSDIFAGTSRFAFGSSDGGLSQMNGRLDSVGLWKSARGAGGALSAAQITRLYNGGLGLAGRDLPSDLLAPLVSFWDCDGTLNDRTANQNNLTNNGGVTFVAGKR